MSSFPRRLPWSLGLLGVALPGSASAFDLTVAQAVVGNNVDITVSAAPPNTMVWIAVSRHLGNGPCPVVLGGLCADLQAPTLVGSGTTSAAGELTITRYLSSSTAVGDYHLQAGHGGPTPAKTPTVRAPVLQILQQRLVVQDAPSATQAQFTLEGEIEVAAGSPTDLVLPYLERGSIYVSDAAAVNLSLPEWFQGYVLNVGIPGPPAGPLGGSAPAVSIDAPKLVELVDLDGVAWGAGGALSAPALASLGSGRLQVVGSSARPTVFDLPALTEVTDTSTLGLSGLRVAADSTASVSVRLDGLDGRGFAKKTDGDALVVAGNVTVSAPLLASLPGGVWLDGVDGRQLPWLDAPVLRSVSGTVPNALNGAVRVTGTGWATLEGLLPRLQSLHTLTVERNDALERLGVIGDVGGLVADTVALRENARLATISSDTAHWSSTHAVIADNVLLPSCEVELANGAWGSTLSECTNNYKDTCADGLGGDVCR